MAFLCKTGHELGLESLVRIPSVTLRHSLSDLLSRWENEVAGLQDTTAQAAERGYADVAAVFARQVLRLQKRIEVMRSSLQAAPAEGPAPLEEGFSNEGLSPRSVR